MQITLAKEVFVEAFKAVEMKGKWFTSTGLKSETLGSFVKIVAKEDNPRRGLHFMNANNQTFVDYWIPMDVEVNETVVLDISKAMKYLNTMSDFVTLEAGQHGCLFTSERKTSKFPSNVIHPNNGACESFFRASQNIDQENYEIEWGEFPITSGFVIEAKDFAKVIKSCEIVGHGVYKLQVTNDAVLITSSINTSELYSENIATAHHFGEATVEYTGPIHSAFKSGFITFYFNDESLVVAISDNVLVARAPYVVV